MQVSARLSEFVSLRWQFLSGSTGAQNRCHDFDCIYTFNKNRVKNESKTARSFPFRRCFGQMGLSKSAKIEKACDFNVLNHRHGLCTCPQQERTGRVGSAAKEKGGISRKSHDARYCRRLLLPCHGSSNNNVCCCIVLSLRRCACLEPPRSVRQGGYGTMDGSYTRMGRSLHHIFKEQYY